MLTHAHLVRSRRFLVIHPARTGEDVLTCVGGRSPAHATGVGLVLLAHADPELQERAIAGPLRRFTDKTICSGAVLRRVLADVRRTGLAISDGQEELVALSVAAPVYGPDDRVAAAVSVVIPADAGESRTLIPAVLTTARGISHALGAPRALRPTSADRQSEAGPASLDARS